VSSKQLRGIYGIPATPFNQDETLDRKGLESVLRFTVESGCQGMAVPIMASEYQSLTDEERRLVVETAVRVVDGRIPVVAGVTGVSNVHAIELARHAEGAGADAVIAMSPFSAPSAPGETERFFQEISRAIGIPVFIQNHLVAGGLGPEALAKICRDNPNVSYIKEETRFAGRQATRTMELAGDACAGIMGGMSCRHLVAEFRRGMCGNMPGSHWGDVVSVVWNKLEEGDEAGARENLTRLQPLLNFELMGGMVAFKEVLVRRGVIASNTVRSPGAHPLDRHDMEELTALLAGIDDLLTWKSG